MSTATSSAAGAPRRVLPTIVLAQFAGTSLWFAVNAVMPDLQRDWGLPASAVGTLTSAVQLGFIAGTLVFALLTIADRHSPRLVFLLCALAGSGCNAAAVGLDRDFNALLALRFATGFFLAGIYPVGMKIAAAWYSRGLGGALGLLIGALVLGTAAPHGLRALDAAWPWQSVMLGVSGLALAGGVLLYLLVPDSPHLPRAARIRPQALAVIWTDRRVRASAFGYFGHMWELYAMWVLVPAILAARIEMQQVPAAAFAVIGAGAIGCAAGGFAAARYGSARVAAVQLAASGLCCATAPLALAAPLPVFALWLAVWGVTVAGDSPQFSTLTAQNAPRDNVGSVLTFVNCIGFAISIVTIQLFAWLAQRWPLWVVLPWLAIGPALGLRMLRPLLATRDAAAPR
ncbi:MFS transporter [Betaproteobacteria bacterium PRO7]|jgi:MFS family permease|nr:MFS transporter [Betaproteobacteria bacterium PRO7]GIL03852.1 MAG: membrane protein [Betaproteobacteria bacterium]